MLAEGFRAFSPLHGVTLLIWLLITLAVLKAGLTQRRRGRERSAAAVLAAVGAVFWVLQQGYYVVFDQVWAHSLPLHVCDLAGIVGPLALLFPRRLLRTVLYFWALGLTAWGLLTPILNVGPDHLGFWLFWLNHGGVVLFAIYDVVVGRYRPHAVDYGMACLVTMAYLSVILPLNLANEGWNYAYIGNVQVEAKTPLDLLPPWPWRILGIQVLGALMYLGVWLPWEVVRWRHRRDKSH